MTAADLQTVNLRPGWLQRTMDRIEHESQTWPAWMKRAAGIRGEPMDLQTEIRQRLAVLEAMTAGKFEVDEVYQTDVFTGNLLICDCDFPQGELSQEARVANATGIAACRNQRPGELAALAVAEAGLRKTVANCSCGGSGVVTTLRRGVEHGTEVPCRQPCLYCLDARDALTRIAELMMKEKA